MRIKQAARVVKQGLVLVFWSLFVSFCGPSIESIQGASREAVLIQGDNPDKVWRGPVCKVLRKNQTSISPR